MSRIVVGHYYKTCLFSTTVLVVNHVMLADMHYVIPLAALRSTQAARHALTSKSWQWLEPDRRWLPCEVITVGPSMRGYMWSAICNVGEHRNELLLAAGYRMARTFSEFRADLDSAYDRRRYEENDDINSLFLELRARVSQQWGDRKEWR